MFHDWLDLIRNGDGRVLIKDDKCSQSNPVLPIKSDLDYIFEDKGSRRLQLCLDHFVKDEYIITVFLNLKRDEWNISTLSISPWRI